VRGALCATTDVVAPAQEHFAAVDAIASPWRESGCNRLAFEFREPGCYRPSEAEWKDSNMVDLYNEDGTVWYSLDLNWADDPREKTFHTFGRQPLNKNFVPLVAEAGSFVLLRMVGESEHWYRVEVNENTKDLKYALKGTRQWGKTSWDHWIYESRVLFPWGQTLRDKPDGTPVENVSTQIEKVNISKVSGDWINVREFGKRDGYSGWIRWRDGRKILIGCILSGWYNDVQFYKLPES